MLKNLVCQLLTYASLLNVFIKCNCFKCTIFVWRCSIKTKFLQSVCSFCLEFSSAEKCERESANWKIQSDERVLLSGYNSSLLLMLCIKKVV